MNTWLFYLGGGSVLVLLGALITRYLSKSTPITSDSAKQNAASTAAGNASGLADAGTQTVETTKPIENKISGGLEDREKAKAEVTAQIQEIETKENTPVDSKPLTTPKDAANWINEVTGAKK